MARFATHVITPSNSGVAGPSNYSWVCVLFFSVRRVFDVRWPSFADARFEAWIVRRKCGTGEYLKLALELGLGLVKRIARIRVHNRPIL